MGRMYRIGESRTCLMTRRLAHSPGTTELGLELDKSVLRIITNSGERDKISAPIRTVPPGSACRSRC